MILTSTAPIITPFGGYVPEQHGDRTSAFAASQLYGVTTSLRESLFSEMLKSLRSALYLQ